MNTFANLPISRKLMTAFAAVVAVIMVSSGIVYDRLRAIEWAKDRRIHTTDVLDTLQDLKEAMLDQETGVRGYLISGDQNFLEPYHKGGDNFSAAIRKIKDLTSNNGAEQNRFDELNELAKKWRLEVAEREIALMAKPETREEARGLEGSGAGKTAMNGLRAKVDEIDRVERDLLARRDAAQRQAYATAYTMTLVGAAASLFIAVLMGVLLTRGITTPITRMTGAMAALAKGDISIEVPEVDRNDEIGAMAAAVQVFKESIIERQKTQAELAHANRVATMGQLTASIAHEVNQPISAVVTNADAALNWLGVHPPKLDKVRESLDHIVADGQRAGDIVHGIRALAKKAPPHRSRFDLNEAVLDVIALVRAEALRHGITLRTQLAEDLPQIDGERIQLQQVLMNLILNAVEAMSVLDRGARDVQICTKADPAGSVLVLVRDSGPGVDAASIERVFQPFYTTKPDGMGMGLAICRSIIEAHGGRLCVTPNEPHGATFEFTIPRS
ncbi:CHASE3 domain-containing protein [Bradyrhizobium sp. C-145]|uniref:CHASE3 domain-containing protein n=1 Tax=Bradyrhizobium sp. C-145 TaxID=574727 RepID=UPI00201B578D|nr:CHASE3 domain-containing protein [Bradyrhizobium sp. C-145]UQR66198.1 CHASE3 domain-containing protein [Bradyrhizobium sp. C-145]